MQLEKEQALFKKESIRAERRIADNREAIAEAKRTEAKFKKDLEYMASYSGTQEIRLLNLQQATAEQTGRELHRIAKTYRSGAYGTVGTYAGLNLLVRSVYDVTGSFERNTFFVEGLSRPEISLWHDRRHCPARLRGIGEISAGDTKETSGSYSEAAGFG